MYFNQQKPILLRVRLTQTWSSSASLRDLGRAGGLNLCVLGLSAISSVSSESWAVDDDVVAPIAPGWCQRCTMWLTTKSIIFAFQLTTEEMPVKSSKQCPVQGEPLWPDLLAWTLSASRPLPLGGWVEMFEYGTSGCLGGGQGSIPSGGLMALHPSVCLIC